MALRTTKYAHRRRAGAGSVGVRVERDRRTPWAKGKVANATSGGMACSVNAACRAFNAGLPHKKSSGAAMPSHKRDIEAAPGGFLPTSGAERGRIVAAHAGAGRRD